MKAYFYQDGIVKLAKEIRGDENVYMGIRPYGFHAGNMSTLVAYPILLCQELVRLGKTPKLNFYLFINDWEQDKLDGPDTTTYPFNVLPQHTTWQFVPDPIDNTRSIVDLWEKIIVSHVQLINYYFPKTTLQAVRNSSMKNTPIMKKYLIKTLRNPESIIKILRENTSKSVSDGAVFASAVCPKCKAARGNTVVSQEEHISHLCSVCKTESKGDYSSFEYWFYHKPLSMPRIETYKIHFSITNGGKFKEGDFSVREKLMAEYGVTAPYSRILYAPVILGANNKTMGKSKGNAVNIGLDKLLQLLKDNPRSEQVRIPELFQY